MANPKIQLRHDTAANWTSVNPILLEGEVGVEVNSSLSTLLGVTENDTSPINITKQGVASGFKSQTGAIGTDIGSYLYFKNTFANDYTIEVTFEINENSSSDQNIIHDEGVVTAAINSSGDLVTYNFTTTSSITIQEDFPLNEKHTIKIVSSNNGKHKVFYLDGVEKTSIDDNNVDLNDVKCNLGLSSYYHNGVLDGPLHGKIYLLESFYNNIPLYTYSKKFKIGDGETNWNNLTYQEFDSSNLENQIEQLEQDYGSLVSKVDDIEEDVDGKVGYDELDAPLAANPIYTNRTIQCNDFNNPINPVYYADLSYYKISGAWNYKQAQWKFSHYDDGGDIVLIRVGSTNSQFRINNIPGCDNYIYYNVKIPTGGAPTWSLSFTEDYNVRLNIRDTEEQIITLPEDIKGYFSSLEDKTFKTDAMLLTDRVAITNIILQEKSSQHLQLLYDNDTLKVNESGQLYADIANIPLVTNSSGVLYNDGSADYTIVGVDDTQTSVDLGISKTGYYVNMLSAQPLQRNHTETIYDTSMNQQIGQQALPSVSSMQELTIPANNSFIENLPTTGGYLFVNYTASAVGDYCSASVCDMNNNFYYGNSHNAMTGAGENPSLFVPIAANCKVKLNYSATTIINTLRFIPIQGS